MASVITSFKYQIDLNLMIDDKNYSIPSESIRMIMPSYDYDRNTMPTIYMWVRLDTITYNRMVNNSDKAILSLRIFKSNNSSTVSFNEPYIEGRFIYNMSSDPNYNEAYEQYISNGKSNELENNYLEGEIGLMNLDLINDNRKLFNDILKDTDLISIIHRYTNHMKMCIEPFDNNQKIDQFIIPPITSITNLLSYINANYCFYKTGYRFFRDFSKTYLLSAQGNAVHDDTNKFDSIIISIRNPLDDMGKVNSMELDSENHAYIINVNANDTSIKVDKMANHQFNSIIGVDTLGNISEAELAIPSTPEMTQKYILERVATNNFDKILNTKNNIESVSVALTISKTEIDSTIITPNKQYQIRNYEDNRQYDGKYILSFKKEVLLRQDDNYISSVMFGLRKVSEE